ncbi:Helicase conserved C-terminal domain-containing protein [Fictibacillus enclensis]|uniref:NgoFVII family restriction endonuclease n=1 Tax=Fictibacillus enclensis TaxID=1017270 RepID=A0A0V8J337_9BACL|nr:DEAD/DEAH box helicase [Fictibacillus enclensis]KSU81120.1 NgoFVII family restriction endonuclease [Fictibacillus enclensis]SCC35268.1 Helicase conserved C-terminal domain-containing protein [Fictibacillus enclensis]
MLKQGIYEEIINKKLKNQLDQLEIDTFEIEKEHLDVEEARKLLASYISTVTRKALKFVRDEAGNDVQQALLDQIRTCNDIIHIISERLGDEEFRALQIEEEGEVLTSLYSRINSIKSIRKGETVRPVTPISQSSLFTGSNYEPNMLGELQKEIVSADQIDMLVSFIKWSGLRCIIEELRTFTETPGKRLRVITTSYMEATDYKAIQELSKLNNTEIKISYDIDRTRLHAKAYLFKRETGFSTAYIGSSNLSNPALTSGLEWNLKVTERDSFDVLKKFEATFESYWNDREFKTFNVDDTKDQQQLKLALAPKRLHVSNELNFLFDIQPFYYQKEILEKLQVEREIHGRMKNLVVAATGVGKTVISAFDYKRFLRQSKGRAKLLFVAHREEILKQSRDTFRAILKDPNFGEMLVGNHTPVTLDHLFVSIQSFNSKKLDDLTSSDYYDLIIVDEFHHAAANSYQKLLAHYQPKVLLGLTATPERMDGKSILSYFDEVIAAEMRLTEAVDKKLLSPFQYFCVSDVVDLSKLKWSRKGYDVKELENVYTSNKMRSNQIIVSLHKYITDIEEVKGLGFCVSIEHAKYMAEFFNKSGIPSIALYGNTNQSERSSAQTRLVNGEIKFIFVVDLYNEGIDIPEINTVLFLRPTESLTVFLQQLGRGLRLSEGKECLTVLDFVGQAHQNYNFEEKFRALVGQTKHSVQYYVENGFFHLPKGCFVQLEKQAKEYILRNIKASTNTKANLISKLKYFEKDTEKELTLVNFLKHYQYSLYDFYGKSGNRSYSRMLVEAGLTSDFECEDEKWITSRLPNLFHLNSSSLLQFLIRYLEDTTVKNNEEQLMLRIFYYSFYQAYPKKVGFTTIEEGIQRILSYPALKEEILEILHYLFESLETLEIENDFSFPCPLRIHSKYNTSQVLAALDYFNEEKSPAFREGVKYFKDKDLDIFFITLNKSEKEFSPSTLYDDYAINEQLFHWQTQSRVAEGSETAKRYIEHRKTGHKIALFVREYKKEHGYTSPFVFLGTADHVSHSGSKPMNFVWRLKEEMPPYFVPRANKNIL